MTLEEAGRAAADEIGIDWRDVAHDGRWHEVPATGKDTRNGAGRIKIFTDEEGGQVCNWITGDILTFWAKGDVDLDPSAREERRKRLEAQRSADEAERQRLTEEAAEKAAALWKAGQPAEGNGYLVRKGVEAVSSLRQIDTAVVAEIIGYAPKCRGEALTGNLLIIPVKVGDKITSCQLIDEAGKKHFIFGGVLRGGYWSTGKLPQGDGTGQTFCIAEGVSTALSIFISTEHMTLAAMSCGNLRTVAVYLRGRYSAARLIVCSDTGNGEADARRAAIESGARLAIPAIDGDGTDFNDLHQLAGSEVVKEQIDRATTPMLTPSPVDERPSESNSESPESIPAPQERHFPLKTGRELRALDIKVEWIVDGLIPRHSVVLLYGRGGIGKTTLMMMIGNAIDQGMAVFGMATVKTQVVVVDFENSLAVLSERAKRTAVDGVLFWDSGQNPPSLDKADWSAYLELLEQYPGAVFVFDTLRSSHSGDENSSEVMTLIMRRMRQLRDAGATVILLHHTPKGNDRQFKGSGAIFDLCDQTLALYQTAKPGSDQEADDDDDDPDKVYRFGTGKKTRYKPHRIFLSFDAEQELFVEAKDPGDDALQALHEIICQIDERTSARQVDIVKAAIDDGGFDYGGEKKIRALLKRGTDRFWTAEKGLRRSVIYRPIETGKTATPYMSESLPVSIFTTSETGNTTTKLTDSNTRQTCINAETGKTAEGVCQSDSLPQIGAIETGNVPLFTEADFEGVLS